MVNDFEIWYADTFGDNKDESRNASLLNSQQQKKRSGSPAKIIRDAAMDEDAVEADSREREGVDVDNDALAYIRSR